MNLTVLIVVAAIICAIVGYNSTQPTRWHTVALVLLGVALLLGGGAIIR